MFKQCYNATKREQTHSVVVKFINVFRLPLLPVTTHNGLVAGSSPAGPTERFNGLRAFRARRFSVNQPING
jgi:hypothetical protein